MAKNKVEHNILTILFWVDLIFQCIGLYLQQQFFRSHSSDSIVPLVYSFSRVFLVPIALIILFRSTEDNVANKFVYIALILSFIADVSTLYGPPQVYFIGLSIYPLSYICFGAGLLIGANKQADYTILLFIFYILLYSTLFGIKFAMPETGKYVAILLEVLHFLALIYLVYSFCAVWKVLYPSTQLMFGAMIGSVLFYNFIFLADFLFFHGRYSYVPSLVGLCYGVYIYTFFSGSILLLKEGVYSEEDFE